MNTLPPLKDFEMEDAHRPQIGFRVIASGGEEWLRNTLGSRNPWADATSQTLLAHLTWKPSPFVSLWKSWPKAVKWAESRQRLGAENIEIVAVYIYDRVVYDAYKAAKTLPLPRNKNINYYKDEVVVHGLGGEDDYSVLAGFSWVTKRKWEVVDFDSAGICLSTSLPVGLLQFNDDAYESERREGQRWQDDGFAALRDEVYSRTGFRNDDRVPLLARLLSKTPAAPTISPRATSRDIASNQLMARFAELGI